MEGETTFDDLKIYFDERLKEIVKVQKELYEKHEQSVTTIISNNLKIINQQFERLDKELQVNKEEIKTVKIQLTDFQKSLEFTEDTLESKIKKNT